MRKNKPTGTREWASHNINIQKGCEHGCLYCYANANAMRFKQVKPGEWIHPIANSPTITNKMRTKLDGTIMFPTTHDITPANLQECLHALGTMLEAKNHILIVTKPHLDCIKTLDQYLGHFKNQVLWRFTMGTHIEETLKFWEPNAPSFQERLRSLAYAWGHGWKTSVSCEPLLTDGIRQTKNLVEFMRPFVTDYIWLGRANHLRARLKLNCPGDPHTGPWGQHLSWHAETLENIWCDKNIQSLYEAFKKDPIIKWKNSVKEIVGLKLNERDGMDV